MCFIKHSHTDVCILCRLITQFCLLLLLVTTAVGGNGKQEPGFHRGLADGNKGRHWTQGKARNEGEGRTRPHAEMRGKGEATRARDETEPSLSILPRQRWHVCPSSGSGSNSIQRAGGDWTQRGTSSDQTRPGVGPWVPLPCLHHMVTYKERRCGCSMPSQLINFLKVYNIYILSIGFL